MPTILILHLKRFHYSDGFLRKIEDLVKFDEEITVGNQQLKYELYAVCNHIGNGYGGHYNSFVKQN